MSQRFNLIPICLLLIMVVGCVNKTQEGSTGQSTQEVIAQVDPKPAAKLPVMPMQELHKTGMGDMNTTEVVRQPTPMDSVLKWIVPQGWQEVSNTSSMRLATLRVIDNPQQVDVSIVLLGGIPGTVEANIERWAGQINLSLDSQQVTKFIKDAMVLETKLGLNAKIFDFSKLQNGESQMTDSMSTAIISLDDVTVFVKMTGTIETVTKNQDRFKALVESIHKK